MLPYYVLTGIVVVFSCLGEIVRVHFTKLRVSEAAARGWPEPKRRVWTPLDIPVVALLVAFAAMRYEVGTDYTMYANIFEKINTSDWQEQIDLSLQEAGYTFIQLVLRSVSDSPYSIFWVMSTLTVVPIYITIKKKSQNVPLALTLFILLAFFVSPFNVMRQGAAVALNFWASTFLDKNKKVFILLNLLASTLHASVLIVAVVQLIVRNWRPSVTSIGVMLSGAIIVTLGLSQFTTVLGWLEFLNPRYDGYVAAETAGVGTYLLIAVYMALLIFSRAVAPLGDSNRYFIFVLLGVAFLIVGTQSVVLSRMEMYLSIFLILLVPNQIEKQQKKMYSILAVTSAAAVFFAFYVSNWGHLTPYQTYIGVMR